MCSEAFCRRENRLNQSKQKKRPSLFYICLCCPCTCMFYCSLCSPCSCLFYSKLCSPLNEFVLQGSSLCCPLCYTIFCATPEHVYSTVNCAVPDHVCSTAACCPSSGLSKSIFQEVMICGN
jgi:hypothetical protein